MKRPILQTLAVCLIATSLAATPSAHANDRTAARTALCDAAPANSFPDVTGIHTPNVSCLVAYGIGQGTTSGTFNPHGPLRREHVATLLTNFLTKATGDTFEAPTANPFADVAQSVHADNIAIAAAHQLTRGITDTQFAPQRFVTRDQFASLVVNTLTAVGHLLTEPTTSTFSDLDGNIHAQNIHKLAQAGIVSGATAERFDPSTPVTRQQAATLLINTAAELHLADLWNAGALGDQTSDTQGPVSPQATVTITQTAINGELLATTGTNTVAVDPLIITGTAETTDSTIVNVQARIDQGEWITATALSGVFNSPEEPFRLVLQDVPDGTRTLTIRAIDANGLSSNLTAYALDVTKPQGATLQSAITDPSENRILLTFNTAVTCVDTPQARAAWNFTNLSLHAPVVGQASGAPDSINPLSDNPTTCALNYTTASIRVSDYGTVSYTRPDPDHAVRAGDGQLQQTAGVTVVDGFAPSLAGVTIGSASSKRVVLNFSEPMQCWTFSQSDFWISVSGVTNDFLISSMECSASSTEIVLNMTEFEFVAGMQVNVAVVVDVFDASGDNKATAPVTATVVVA